MNGENKYTRRTMLIHHQSRQPFGAVSPPLFLTTTFENACAGYSYTRCSNPTRQLLEEAIRTAEGAEYGFAFSSGLAAEDAVFSLRERIVAAKDIYGGTRRLLDNFYKRGAEVVYVDASDTDAVARAAASMGGGIVFAETPANPLMNVCDIGALAEAAHKNGCLLVIDNTFLTPALQRPLEHGADIVVHSATKYLCGHHDSTAGAVVTSDPEAAEKLKLAVTTKGAGLSPFDSFLVRRGMETLELRMKAHCENAREVFGFLKTQKRIGKVYYAGDPESRGYGIMRKQSDGDGGMISFRLEGSDWRRFVGRLELVAFAESLGGNMSLITHPYTQTHAGLTDKEKAEAGITQSLLRLSVGTESPEDIIKDLTYALT